MRLDLLMVKHLSFEGEIVACLPMHGDELLLLQLVNHQYKVGNFVTVRMPTCVVAEMLFNELPQADTKYHQVARSIYGWALAGYNGSLAVFHSFANAPYPLVDSSYGIDPDPLALLWTKSGYELQGISSSGTSLILAGTDDDAQSIWIDGHADDLLEVKQDSKQQFEVYGTNSEYLPQFQRFATKLGLPQIKSNLGYLEEEVGFTMIYSSTEGIIRTQVDQQGTLLKTQQIELVSKQETPNAYLRANNTDLVIVNGCELVAFS